MGTRKSGSILVPTIASLGDLSASTSILRVATPRSLAVSNVAAAAGAVPPGVVIMR
jgi:hypothetical protein